MNGGDINYCTAMLCLTSIWAAIQERPSILTSAIFKIAGSNVNPKSCLSTSASSDVTNTK